MSEWKLLHTLSEENMAVYEKIHSFDDAPTKAPFSKSGLYWKHSTELDRIA
jgi:hypothetical protein